MGETITVGPVAVPVGMISLDIDGVGLYAVTIIGRDAVVAGSGGDGWWIDAHDGRRAVVRDVSEMEYVFSVPDMPERLWSRMAATLRRWCDDGTSLRVIGTTQATLLWDGATMIPLPAQSYPADAKAGA